MSIYRSGFVFTKSNLITPMRLQRMWEAGLKAVLYDKKTHQMLRGYRNIEYALELKRTRAGVGVIFLSNQKVY